MARIRDFDPKALDRYAVESVKPSYEHGKGVYGDCLQFVILLPRRIMTEQGEKNLCTPRDEELLYSTLFGHFGGCTVDKSLVFGLGMRDAKLEKNRHRRMLVVASVSDETLCYFQALRKELQDCSGEEQVFITKQPITIL